MDLLLQPSWTWGPIGPRHFAANALRAVENGATYVRCGSDGVSGVVGPYYNILHKQFTRPTAQTLVFEFPQPRHVFTLYAQGYGWLFDAIVQALAVLLWLSLLLVPQRHQQRAQLPEWDAEMPPGRADGQHNPGGSGGQPLTSAVTAPLR